MEFKRQFEDEEITIRIALQPPPDSFPDEEQGMEDMAEAAGIDFESDEYKQHEREMLGLKAKNDDDDNEAPSTGGKRRSFSTSTAGRKKNEEENNEAENEVENEGEEGTGGEEDDNPYNGHTLNFTVLVYKPKSNKTLAFEMLSDQGALFMNGVTLFTNGSLPFETTAEAEMKRAFVYQGPTIIDLPVEMRSALTDYLDRRGINDDVAKFVLEYVWYKEQNEYVRLLKGISDFVAVPEAAAETPKAKPKSK